MRHTGTARLDRKTKNLVKRLGRNDIAIVDHEDMDRVSAESLLATGVEVVINAAQSISGVYPNLGPLILARGGVAIVDEVGRDVFDQVREGDVIEVEGDSVRVDGREVARGTRLTVTAIEDAMELAKAGIGDRLDEFARNTLQFLDKEKALLTDGTGIPETRTVLKDRHVMVVVRGYDYREDMRALVPYVREMKPVLVGVDGGADALLEAGFVPDIILGDMDSVSDAALRCGAELIVHAYPDGRCPGQERLEQLAVEHVTWPLGATSEDLALLLAYESGADLIVAVGMHDNLLEYLDKGRKGMASSFLTRLKVGPKLVDAKGVNKLYRTSVGPSHLLLLVAAALATVSAVVMISPSTRGFLALVLLRLRAWIGL